MNFTTDELRAVDILEGLSEPQLAWFAEHGLKVQLARGEHMFERGQPADFMFIVVNGTIEGYEEVGGELLLVATTHSGQVTGMLPYSRMHHYPRFTVAVEASDVLRLEKREFAEMLGVSQEIGQRLVAEMADRVRGDVRLEQQQERMAALGRLSAGLAHELNNPAAAVGRAASGLGDELTRLSQIVMNLVQLRLDEAGVLAINHLQTASTGRQANMSPVVRSERAEDIGTWLDDHGVPEAADVAETFADAGLEMKDLEVFAQAMPAAALPDALAWVACRLAVQEIAGQIASSAERISELVGSVKVYSHMDRSTEHKPTDVRAGIDNTLTLLSHKLKSKNIRLARNYQTDLPLVPANAGELNQAWTNLIDNAIDAVDEAGEIRITARADEAHVDVSITDDGHGIPEEFQSRIFEPFFTTKPVGEGTGLGLDIAMRIVKTHRGSLTISSQSGRTTACVQLPLSTGPS